MGREIKRVPSGFRWPIDKTWFGYILPPVPCELCGGDGLARADGKETVTLDHGHSWKSEFCPVCEGDGVTFPRIEVPEGEAWQIWQTVSEGGPITPPFDTPEELARWCQENQPMILGNPLSYEQWLAFIQAGWAPSMVMTPTTGVISGVEFVANEKLREKPAATYEELDGETNDSRLE